MTGGRVKKVKPAFEEQPNDHAQVKLLKSFIKLQFKVKVIDRFQLVDYQAAILCPLTRDVCYFSNIYRGIYNKRNEAIADLKIRLGDLAVKMARANDNDNGNDNGIGDENDEDEDDDDNDEEAEFNDWEVADDEQEFDEGLIRSEAIRQFDNYMNTKWNAKIQNDSWKNPYNFWMDDKIKSIYPILTILAVWLLCIPVTTAAIERLFSLAKIIISGKRGGRMSDEVLSMLTELKKDLKFSKYCEN